MQGGCALEFKQLTSPLNLYSRREVLSKTCPIPNERGLYAWFFKEVPPNVPSDTSIEINGKVLLYAGISPKNEISKQNLRKRIKTHFRGNAEGSTLRLTLGVLLEPLSGFPLRRVGSGTRMTLTHEGEQWLDEWMRTNAFVCWMEHEFPWQIENELLKTISLPLNIMDNDHHPFAKHLSKLRSIAKQTAREMPIADEDGLTRQK